MISNLKKQKKKLIKQQEDQQNLLREQKEIIEKLREELINKEGIIKELIEEQGILSQKLIQAQEIQNSLSYIISNQNQDSRIYEQPIHNRESDENAKQDLKILQNQFEEFQKLSDLRISELQSALDQIQQQNLDQTLKAFGEWIETKLQDMEFNDQQDVEFTSVIKQSVTYPLDQFLNRLAEILEQKQIKLIHQIS